MTPMIISYTMSALCFGLFVYMNISNYLYPWYSTEIMLQAYEITLLPLVIGVFFIWWARAVCAPNSKPKETK